MNQDALRNLLLARRAELSEQLRLGTTAAKPVALDPSAVGRLSRMDALQGQAVSVEAQRRRRLTLSRITAALARLDADEYGDCLRCGETILEARLAHDPAATLCVQCASQAERESPNPFG